MPESRNTRGSAPQESILASRPVSASDWSATARLQNHIAGRGRVLVPAMRPEGGDLSKNVVTYAFWLVPSYQALVRRWRVSAQCDGELSVSFNGGADVTDVTPGLVDLPRGITFDEVLGSQSSTQAGATVEVDSDGDTCIVDSIECFELPRAVIAADSNELGVDLPPFRSSLPIQAAAFTNIYAGAMNAGAGKRVLFQWAVPYAVGGATSTAYASSTTSSTFSNMFTVAKPCLTRKVYNDGNAYTACTARVFAWVTPGGSGQFRVTTASGNSAAATITNTSPAWSNAVVNANVLHEDLTEADGIPGGGYDDVNIQFRATSGTLYVASAIVFET